jgi:hypothetical protein
LSNNLVVIDKENGHWLGHALAILSTRPPAFQPPGPIGKQMLEKLHASPELT